MPIDKEVSIIGIVVWSALIGLVIALLVWAMVHGAAISDKRNQEYNRPRMEAYKNCTQQCLKLGYACKSSDPFTRVCVCDTTSKAIRLEK